MRSKVVAAIGKFVIMGGMALAVVSSMPESALQAEAATKAQLKEFRSELKSMILSADSSVHDVEKYNMTYQESYSVWKDLANSDCKFACNTGMIYENVSRNASGKIKTYQIVNLDKDFLNRYNSLCKSVDEVVAGIDEDMNDVEKVLYIHEYLMENVYFKKEDTTSYTAGGPLGYGYGVCQGYSQAMRLLLSEVGIQSELVSSVDMNHAWLYVNLDGEWYHTDVLWDDVEKVEGAQRHIFLLKNDDEFQNVNGYKHYNWYIANSDELSDSTRFSNWFVHDVQGLMRYYNGFWYFQQGNCIMKSKIDGTEMSQVVRETSKVVLNALEDGVLFYTVGDKTLAMDLIGTAGENFAQLGSGEEWSIEAMDWTKIGFWKSGHYSPTDGKYASFDGRICLRQFMSVEIKEYEIHVAENYHVLIREFDKNGSMVKSNNLEEGAVFVPTEDTVSIAVSLYNTENASVTYREYKELLASGGISITSAEVELPEAEEKSGFELLDWTDIYNWQSGHYTPDMGVYARFKGRICLKELLPVVVKEYRIHVAAENYHVLIREFNEDGVMIKSNNLEDGAIYVPTEDTVSVAVSLYNTENANVTFEEYKELLATGAISITKANEEFTDQAEAGPECGLESMDWTNIEYWRIGHYNMTTAKYEYFQGRICLKEFAPVEKKEYEIHIAAENYHVLIREFNKKGTMIKSNNLEDGVVFVPTDDTVSVAVSLYNTEDTSVTYGVYKELLNAGAISITAE